MRILICAFVVRIWHKQVFSWHGSTQKGHFSIVMILELLICNWAASWQNQQCGCAPSEDLDQPGHPPSLIRVFAVRMKKAWVLSYPFSAQRRLWSDWADAQADLSLRWAHSESLCWFCHEVAQLQYVLENSIVKKFIYIFCRLVTDVFYMCILF